MGQSIIEGIALTPLKIIENPRGNLFHALKRSEDSFKDFGEAYLTTVLKDTVKGWRKHSRMQLNLVVLSGEVQFVIYDDRESSRSKNQFQSVKLSLANYQRLTVSPGLWVAFKGHSADANLILNIASIEHDPHESITCDLEKIKYEW